MATQLRELEVDAITRGHLEKGLASLESEFAGVFSRETIERYMAESLDALPGSRLKDFVPLLVHRFARERLRALGQVEGMITKDVPEVLFVCVQNAGRSQIAAALLDHYADGRVHVRSAGSEPADPAVVEALNEVGVDISKAFPKPMTDEVVRAADAVVTMGCGDAVRSILESATRTGRSTIPPRPTSRAYGGSATVSVSGYVASSKSWRPRRARVPRPGLARRTPRRGLGCL